MRPAVQASPVVVSPAAGLYRHRHSRSLFFRPCLVKLTAIRSDGQGELEHDNDVQPQPDSSDAASSTGRSTLSLIRNGFVEALAAIAASRIKANDVSQEELKQTWLSARTATMENPTDIQPSLLEQIEDSEDLRHDKKDLTSPGFSFSAAGLLFPYHLGVGQCLIEHKCITEKTPLSGSSAGAIVCAVIACGLSMQDAMLATKELASNCRQNGTAFRLGAVLRKYLDDSLPEDAHIRSSGRIRVAITQLFGSPKALLVEQFYSKKDLVDGLLTSCFIPGYIAPRPVTLYRNRICMDGGVTSFMPPTAADVTVRVCAFPAAQLGLMNISISPDCNPENRASPRQLLSWALEPAAEDVLERLFHQGYHDALVWVSQQASSALIRSSAK